MVSSCGGDGKEQLITGYGYPRSYSTYGTVHRNTWYSTVLHNISDDDVKSRILTKTTMKIWL